MLVLKYLYLNRGYFSQTNNCVQVYMEKGECLKIIELLQNFKEN